MIISSFSCTIFSDIVYCLLSEWCVVTSFCQSLQTIVYPKYAEENVLIDYGIIEEEEA